MDKDLEAKVRAKYSRFRQENPHWKHRRSSHHRWIYPQNRRPAIQRFGSQQVASIKKRIK
jgi:hypothetical protein